MKSPLGRTLKSPLERMLKPPLGRKLKPSLGRTLACLLPFFLAGAVLALLLLRGRAISWWGTHVVGPLRRSPLDDNSRQDSQFVRPESSQNSGTKKEGQVGLLLERIDELLQQFEEEMQEPKKEIERQRQEMNLQLNTLIREMQTSNVNPGTTRRS